MPGSLVLHKPAQRKQTRKQVYMNPIEIIGETNHLGITHEVLFVDADGHLTNDETARTKETSFSFRSRRLTPQKAYNQQRRLRGELPPRRQYDSCVLQALCPTTPNAGLVATATAVTMYIIERTAPDQRIISPEILGRLGFERTGRVLTAPVFVEGDLYEVQLHELRQKGRSGAAQVVYLSKPDLRSGYLLRSTYSDIVHFLEQGRP